MHLCLKMAKKSVDEQSTAEYRFFYQLDWPPERVPPLIELVFFYDPIRAGPLILDSRRSIDETVGPLLPPAFDPPARSPGTKRWRSRNNARLACAGLPSLEGPCYAMP